MLTGDSLPVEKATDPVSEDTVVGARRRLAFSGTLVTAGQSRGIVVETGERTEIGRINVMLAEVGPCRCRCCASSPSSAAG